MQHITVEADRPRLCSTDGFNPFDMLGDHTIGQRLQHPSRSAVYRPQDATGRGVFSGMARSRPGHLMADSTDVVTLKAFTSGRQRL